MSLREIWKAFIKGQYLHWYKKEIDQEEEEIDRLRSEISQCRIDKLLLEGTIEDKKNKIIELNEEISDLKELLEDDDREEAECFGTITNADLRGLLISHSKTVKLSDMIYGLTTVEEAKEFTKATRISINEWKKEEFDCDEFSFALMGYWNLDLYQFAFGIAWTKTHAFNIMIDSDKQIWIVEPQTNRFYKIEDKKDQEAYYPMDIIMI